MRVTPVVPCQGSVGASGDLAPLAHMTLTLIGEGEAFFRGERMSSAAALERAGLQPVTLGAKEGLALINGTQVMTAIGALGVLRAERLAAAADVIGAMSLEAFHGSERVFDRRLNELRPHPGQMRVAKNLRALLGGIADRASLTPSADACKTRTRSVAFPSCTARSATRSPTSAA